MRLVAAPAKSVAASIKLLLVGLLSCVTATDLAAAVLAEMLVGDVTLPWLTRAARAGGSAVFGPLLLLVRHSNVLLPKSDGPRPEDGSLLGCFGFFTKNDWWPAPVPAMRDAASRMTADKISLALNAPGRPVPQRAEMRLMWGAVSKSDAES